MYFLGDPVKVLGTVNLEKIHEIVSVLYENYSEKWIKRTFKLMENCYCLKAMTPSHFDVPDTDTQAQLMELLYPLVEPHIGPNEKLLYLDVSSVPPNQRTLVHIDHALMHIVSRRLHIPIVTNDKVRFALFTEQKFWNYHLSVGKVYEINNEIPHLAVNLGATDRWHIIVDIIDNDAYEFLCKNNKLIDKGIDPAINFLFNQNITFKLNEIVESEAINA